MRWFGTIRTLTDGDEEKKRLFSLIFSHFYFPLTYKILMQRRQGKFYLPYQELGVEKDAGVQSGKAELSS